MAAFASTRGSFRAVASSSILRPYQRVNLVPQLQARLPRILPAVSKARTFVTSSALKEKKYTVDHEWIELSEDGKTGTIGVSVYAAKNLGDVVYVELPTIGLEASKGDSIGAVESVKSASDIMTPVSGKIVEANDVLQEKPGTINKGPESDGWIAKIEVKDAEEVKELMNDVEYGQFTAE